MDPNSEAIKTKPVLPGNRPDYVAQGLDIETQPARIITPIYHEIFARTVVCVAVLQIINPEILFWPIGLDEVASMKEECGDHPDWFMIDLDNSVEKTIAKCWRFFPKDIISNSAAASKMALVIGRAIDRECTTANSVFINMLHSGYDQLVKSGALYGAIGESGALQLKHQTGDIDAMRQIVSEKVLELAQHVTPLVKQYMSTINNDFLYVDTVRDAIMRAHMNDENFVVFGDYFRIEGEALRMLINDESVNWVLQPMSGNMAHPGIPTHYSVFPVFPARKMNPFRSMTRKEFVEWADANESILYANPDTREGITVNSIESALEIIAALTKKEEGCTDIK